MHGNPGDCWGCGPARGRDLGAVSRRGRRETAAFVRLYMVPGMQHYEGGPVPNSFGQFGAAPSDEPERNVARALERWVETGEVPSAILATKHVDDDPAKGVEATRPVCGYPQTATYKGQDAPSDGMRFTCTSEGTKTR